MHHFLVVHHSLHLQFMQATLRERQLTSMKPHREDPRILQELLWVLECLNTLKVMGMAANHIISLDTNQDINQGINQGILLKPLWSFRNGVNLKIVSLKPVALQPAVTLFFVAAQGYFVSAVIQIFEHHPERSILQSPLLAIELLDS